MSRRPKSDTYIVRDSVYLKKSAKSPFYQYYFRIHSQTIRASTHTADLQKAEDIALAAYYDIRKSGITIKQKKISFAQLATMHLNQIQQDKKYTFHSENIKRYFLPFFENFKNIRDITTSDIDDYILYRKKKSKKIPKPQTINKENSVLRQMLNHAYRKALIINMPEIQHQNEKQSFFRRQHFTIAEYRILIKTASRRIKECANKPLMTTILHRRQLLKDYIIVLLNCGIRVDESKTVVWKSVDLEKHTIKLESAGKVRSSRTLYVRVQGIAALKRIKKRRTDCLEKSNRAFNQNEFVFCTPNGRPVKSMRKAFVELIKACEFDYQNDTEKHSLTSLRHSYATFSLTRKDSKKVSMRTLSIQMGTSTRMLEKHYSHDAISDYSDALT